MKANPTLWQNAKLMFQAGAVFGLGLVGFSGAASGNYDVVTPAAFSLKAWLLAPLIMGALFALPSIVVDLRDKKRAP